MQRPLQHLEVEILHCRAAQPAPQGTTVCRQIVKAGQSLARVLTKLFNMALDSGTRPSQWRQGIVASILSKVTSRPQQLPPHHSSSVQTSSSSVLTKRLHAGVPCTTTSSLSEKIVAPATPPLPDRVSGCVCQGQPTYVFFQDISKAYVVARCLMYKLHQKGTGKMWHMIRIIEERPVHHA
jgi:hypothetical protein